MWAPYDVSGGWDQAAAGSPRARHSVLSPGRTSSRIEGVLRASTGVVWRDQGGGGAGEGGREWRALATTSWVETAAGAVAGTSRGGPAALAGEGVSGSFQGGRDPRPTAVMHEAGVLAER